MNIYTNQLSINKYALRSYATRPISFKATSSDIPSEREIITTILQNKLDPSLVDPKTKKTLFFTIVENDMCNAVNYLCMKPKLIADVINTPTDGKTPLDAAKSDKMKHILLAKKAKHFSELSFNEVQKTQVVSQEAQVIKSEEPLVEDARVAAIKANLKEPIVVKPNEVTKPDYFDAFEEVDDEIDVNEEEAAEINNTQEVTGEQKDTLTETNVKESRTTVERKIPETYNKYNVLEIKPSDPKTLDEIIGLENIKRELDENVIKPLKEQEVSVTLKANNVDLPNGILLSSVADPESVVKAVSNETGMPVLQVINLEELSPMINDVKKNFKETGTKTILFIPKFDKLFVEQQSQMPERNFTLLMNQCREKGVLLIATTDDKEKVCKSFMQPGIFDKILEVQKPTLEDRRIYLKQYFGDKHLFSDLQTETTINELATIMDGFNYSAIDRVLEESARTAVSNSKDKVSREIVDNELKEFTAERGLTPVDKNNVTGQYDTEMKRVPVTEHEPKSLDELGGMPEIKDRLRKLYIEPLKNIDILKQELGNAAIPDGAIFYGPAGNGKTLTAKTLARELGLPFYETKLSDIGTSYVHEESRAMRKLAQQLRDKYKATGEMSVWFLDEFDSLGSERNGASQHNKELVDTLLQEFNNPSEMGYILIAATNDLSNVDSALKRRGRLGNWIPFHNPEFIERVDTIRKELNKANITRGLAENHEYVEKLAKELDGNSMSNIVSVINDAKRMHLLSGDDFDAAIKKALDLNTKREMGEFCNKAGLEAHTYKDTDYKSLDELGGMEDTKKQLTENVVNVWEPKTRNALIANRRTIPGGVILEGPPGGGKTTIVETLARQMDVPLYKMDYSKQQNSSYIHATSRNVTEIFEKLKLQSKILKKPVMLFFDEAEKFFPRDAREHQIEEVNTYKELMNNASKDGIILIGATNHIDQVNAEIIGNPRRMGTVIHVGNPNVEGRKNLLEKILKGLPAMESDLDDAQFDELAKITEGLSIGKIADGVDKVISQAIKSDNKVTYELLRSTLQNIGFNKEIEEFCNKAGLEAHTYKDSDYKSLDELGGMEDTKKQLTENIIDVWKPEVRQALIANRRNIPGGCILEGPPGGGKTTIVETLARQMDVPLYKMDYSKQHNTEFIHAVSRNVSEIFERLKLQSKILKKPVILFFDEAEKFFPRHAERHQIEEVNTYKELMNNASKDGIILIGATNHIDQVNAEIIGNPRRMGTVIHVGNPDEEGRKNLLEKILTGLPVMAAALTVAQIKELAKITEGLSIGKIADGIDKVITQAVKRNSKVSFEMLSNSLKKIAR